MEKLITRFLILCSVLFFLISCNNNAANKSNTIKQIEAFYDIKVSKNIRKIFILNENQYSCPNCFKSFSTYLAEKKIEDNELLLINNTGSFLNRKRYIKKKNTHVVYNTTNTNHDLIPFMSVIYLSDDFKVEKIIEVTPNNVNEIIIDD